jgi:hypothetical protein
MKNLSRREFVALAVGGAATIAGVAWAETNNSHNRGAGSTASMTVSGTFYSQYRHRDVGYSVGYPTGHGPGSKLPLIVFMHGFRGSHIHCLAGYSPGEAVSITENGHPVAPMAIVTVDGGNGYWHPHPNDDPMGMIIHELIPMMQRRGLGVAPQKIMTMGATVPLLWRSTIRPSSTRSPPSVQPSSRRTTGSTT